MNNVMNTTNQTPIEIALGIDENGMTTARKLYEFLEMTKVIIQDGISKTLLIMHLQQKMKIISHSPSMANAVDRLLKMQN